MTEYNPRTVNKIDMKVPINCPHCNVLFNQPGFLIFLWEHKGVAWDIEGHYCPSCHQPIFYLTPSKREGSGLTRDDEKMMMVYPKGRRPVPAGVPNEEKNLFIEACIIFEDSPRASAALSRYLLQYIIRKKLGIKPKKLIQEIDEVIEKQLLRPSILEDLHALRQCGNIAAHPLDYSDTGELIPVEKEDADFTLTVIETIFDELYHFPQRQADRRKKIREKYNKAK